MTTPEISDENEQQLELSAEEMEIFTGVVHDINLIRTAQLSDTAKRLKIADSYTAALRAAAAIDESGGTTRGARLGAGGIILGAIDDINMRNNIYNALEQPNLLTHEQTKILQEFVERLHRIGKVYNSARPEYGDYVTNQIRGIEEYERSREMAHNEQSDALVLAALSAALGASATTTRLVRHIGSKINSRFYPKK